MKLRIALVLIALSAPAAFGQKWEFGGGGGFGFYTNQNVTNAIGDAEAKFASNVAASAWLANNSSSLWGGELRYDFQRGDMQLNSGGTKATFGAESHAVHYDFQFHFAPRSSPVRPFVAFGGGAKVYRGSGTEVAFQPLNRIALLTRTNDVRPMISAGAGVKVNMGKRLGLRLELHDYITPFPEKVIAPAANSSVGGWIHDFVATVGISFLFAN